MITLSFITVTHLHSLTLTFGHSLTVDMTITSIPLHHHHQHHHHYRHHFHHVGEPNGQVWGGHLPVTFMSLLETCPHVSLTSDNIILSCLNNWFFISIDAYFLILSTLSSVFLIFLFSLLHYFIIGLLFLIYLFFFLYFFNIAACITNFPLFLLYFSWFLSIHIYSNVIFFCSSVFSFIYIFFSSSCISFLLSLLITSLLSLLFFCFNFFTFNHTPKLYWQYCDFSSSTFFFIPAIIIHFLYSETLSRAFFM